MLDVRCCNILRWLAKVAVVALTLPFAVATLGMAFAVWIPLIDGVIRGNFSELAGFYGQGMDGLLLVLLLALLLTAIVLPLVWALMALRDLRSRIVRLAAEEPKQTEEGDETI